MNRFGRSVSFSVAVLFACASLAASATSDARKPLDPDAVKALVTAAGAKVSIHAATGAARFVALPAAKPGSLTPSSGKSVSLHDQTMAFLGAYGAAFGLRSPAAELRLVRTRSDKQAGGSHLTYQQVHDGLPVFGALLRAHFDGRGQLRSVNGTIVPKLTLGAQAKQSPQSAAATAVSKVRSEKGAGAAALSTRLVFFRENLARGIPGDNHLAYEVVVGNGAGIKEFVYVDAHTGRFIDQITGIQDAMSRRAYDGANLTTVPATYPGTPFWVEGDTLPTTGTCTPGTGGFNCNAEADNMLFASKETYDLYFNAFGRDSFDDSGTKMDAIFDRGYGCPNASWNGTFISFCPGITTDDVTGHEWTHAYTEYTDGLIYAWQPGALNESYSDIFGETVDRINARGGDTPDNARSADACSLYYGTPPPILNITGGSAAGSYFSQASVNEPATPFTVGPTPMALAVPASACTAVSGVSGSIAIIDFTLLPSGASECGSGTRAGNALAAGATGIIFVAPPEGLLNLSSRATIGSVEVTNADGATIKAGLPADATFTLGVGTDDSVRWLMGEDSTAVGLVGALRDMWNPRCFGNPGKVSDSFEYVCSTGDQGGVHTNSGVPNHGYALIVDGGTYNGQTITGLGLLKAAHIYFRAMDVYQVPNTDFADHADAIEQSCADLIGADLNGFDGVISATLTSADCDEVHKAALAVELRDAPTFCNFQPMLAKSPPPVCGAGGTASSLYSFDFETDPFTNGWTVNHVGVNAEFTARDWVRSDAPPPGGTGYAVFAIDYPGGDCTPGSDDQSGVIRLDSPAIDLPVGSAPVVSFDHWMASEEGWDGGNLKISTNGGATFALVNPAAYVYNAYNRTMIAAAQGNTSPLAGQKGYSGADGGSVDGSWGKSIVNLAGYAYPGQTVKLRWEFGQDGCGANYGWFVDNVAVDSCLYAKTPIISVAPVSGAEGNSGTTPFVVTVRLSTATSNTVTVDYATANGSARASDYTATSGTLTFNPGETIKTFIVDVTGDTVRERNEFFFVNLSSPSNGTIGRGTVRVVIRNDD